jgi:hypothetical protein
MFFCNVRNAAAIGTRKSDEQRSQERGEGLVLGARGEGRGARVSLDYVVRHVHTVHRCPCPLSLINPSKTNPTVHVH